MGALAVGLLAGTLAAAPIVSVRELTDHIEIAAGRVRAVKTNASVGGTQGWAFDLDARCRLAAIVRTEGQGESALVVFTNAANDLADPDKRLVFRSKFGLSSPQFGPGDQVSVVEGARKIRLLNGRTGELVATVSGRVASWAEDGSLLVHDYLKGCHRAIRYKGGDERLVGETCEGFAPMPVVAGVAPTGAPLPIVDAGGRVVSLLGGTPGSSGVRLEIRAGGVGCRNGITYQEFRGQQVSLVQRNGVWGFVPGAACEWKNESNEDGTPLSYKVQSCQPPEE